MYVPQHCGGQTALNSVCMHSHRPILLIGIQNHFQNYIKTFGVKHTNGWETT